MTPWQKAEFSSQQHPRIPQNCPRTCRFQVQGSVFQPFQVPQNWGLHWHPLSMCDLLRECSQEKL